MISMIITISNIIIIIIYSGLTKIKVAGNESLIRMADYSIHERLLTSNLKMTMVCLPYCRYMTLYFINMVMVIIVATHVYYDKYDHGRDFAPKYTTRVSTMKRLIL